MSNKKLLFSDRVVLVTGAGNGLGKEYALAFGQRGAKVIVNDLGGDLKGEGKSSRPADIVVEEIRSKGGTAVANYDSVEDAEKLVKTALDSFGRIDVIIHNAGILRDRSFARISDGDWDIIHRIHLRSVFLISRAAWPHMKNQNFGRIIVVSSAAGIYGNFGQANYSAAKMGVVGLMNTLAVEGRKNNILVNAVAPMAASRLTLTVLPEQMLESLKPEYVVPLILWLCHEDCQETGGLYECGGGWFAKLRWQRTHGVMLRQGNAETTPEEVRDNWDKISDFSDASYPTSIQEANMAYFAALQSVNEGQKRRIKTVGTAASSSSIVNAIGAKVPSSSFSYTERNAILYALGVGVSTKQEDHLQFLYEGHSNFSVLPTYAVIPAMKAIEEAVMSGSITGLNIDPTMILHGEQYVEVFKPLPPADTLVSSGCIADILDKGSGALIIYNVDTYDSHGNKVAFNQSSVFVQRAGGFGGKRSSDKAFLPVNPPQRSPCASISEKTSVDQAALYRLNGDRNPLHIDPSFSALAGFSTPILHGLCSFGYAVRHVLRQFCGNDVSKFKAVKVRFSSPVLPGETLQTDMWKEGSRVFIQCKVVETGKICLAGGYVDIFETAPAVVNPSSSSQTANLLSDAVFTEVSERVKGKPEVSKVVNAVYLFEITDGGKTISEWTADLRKDQPPAVYRGQPKGGISADCTLTISDKDLFDLANGKLDGQKAFAAGKLKVRGNVMLTLRLGSVFNANKSKL